ncbi:MAG: cytochrome c biogenesis protein ResB [Candidatus Hydrogenedentes bacterium]|nr:cytochrome c biogenesis protein ResB [Candidatus Hydrogenedentota bacterium]
MQYLKAAYRAAASYAVSIAILFFLLALTLLGTLEQIDHGLFAAQQKYFNSLFVMQEVFGHPILPLPGVYLLLVLLFINLTLGGVLRFRPGWSHVGVFIVHLGILFMLLGGFVTFKYSTDGHLTLYEGERSNEFQSYFDWEIAITEARTDGPARAFIIPGSQFTSLKPGENVTFHRDDLPFDLHLSDYAPNAEVRPAMPGPDMSASVGNLVLQPQPLDPEGERNVAGLRAKAMIKGEPVSQESLLWGLSSSPFRVTAGSQAYDLTLRRRSWQLPFEVVLDDFTRELHPGTSKPSSFSSDVTILEPQATQQIHISMNKPLRYKGYTLFQASWGPQDAGPNDRLFSTFAVVKNPADHWPLYACIIITIGLLVHFCYRLIVHLKKEARVSS